MIPALLGAALSVAGGAYSGIQSAKAAKRAKEAEEAGYQANLNNLRKRINQDYTQTASAQAALNRGRQAFMDQLSTVRGEKAVGMATDASVAQQKAQANQAMADAVSNVAVAGEQRAEAAQDAMNSLNTQHAQNVANQEITNAQQNAAAGGQLVNLGLNAVASSLNGKMGITGKIPLPTAQARMEAGSKLKLPEYDDMFGNNKRFF